MRFKVFSDLWMKLFVILDWYFVYLKDVLFFYQNEEQHLRGLRIVFKRFKDCGIVLNAEKSIFGQKEVKFLGYLVS